jgi:integrating conjugative element relaxase (TIGR03760 family)
MMPTLLKRRRQKEQLDPPGTSAEGYLQPLCARELLKTEQRRRLLSMIWEQTALPHALFQKLYLVPIHRYAALVQQLPASETHHHAYLGGMLEHGLELAAHGLKLRRSYLLPPGSAPEDQAREADAWSTAIAYAGLLHDIGKIAVDIQVEQLDGSNWHPWHGPLEQPYRFRYRKGRDYKLHTASAGLLYGQVLDCDILDWLSGYPNVWARLLYLLAGQYEHAGLLGELIVKADRISTAEAVGGDPRLAQQAPVDSLQRQLLMGMRHLIQHELRLNRPGAAGWLTQDALWLVSKVFSDKLRAHLLSQSISAVPSRNSALFNELQAHRLVVSTDDGQAVWNATIQDGEWCQTLTFLRVEPSLIWGSETGPTPFKGSVTVNAEISPEPQESSAVAAANETSATGHTPERTKSPSPPSPEDSAPTPSQVSDAPITPHSESNDPGEVFLAWLKQAIRSHKLIINDSEAKVHLVGGSAFLVTPGIFQRYCAEFPGIARGANGDKDEWRWVQKRFEKLNLHRKTAKGLNIWTCQVEGPRKRGRTLKGYILEPSELIFDSAPLDNPFLKIVD